MDLSYNMRNLCSRVMTKILRDSFRNKVVESFLEALNMTFFHVSPFKYCLEGRGQCPNKLLLRFLLSQ